jgi:hypothetical protein
LSGSMRISGNPIKPVIRKQTAESASVPGKGGGQQEGGDA